jgi:hypothetical protein
MNFKNIINFLFLILFLTKTSFAGTAQANIQELNLQEKSIELKILSHQKILFKQKYFENLFSKKNTTKKLFYLIAGTGLVFGATYTGYKLYKAYKSKKQESQDNINSQESNNSSKPKKGTTFYYFYKGLGKGVKVTAVSAVFLIATRSFDLLKDNFLDIFDTKDNNYFAKIAQNNATSLEQLDDIFSVKNNERIFKQDIIGFANYFTENLESLLAITNALIKLKIKNLSNIEILKNAHALMIKKYLSFYNNLKIILDNNNLEYFTQQDAINLKQEFDELTSQIVRFIKLANSIIYEN